MSGISRFFAPAKCAGASADASVVAHSHTSNSTTDADAPPTDNDKVAKNNESIVDGVPIDKDGWQVFPTTVATNTNGNGDAGSVVCIEIDDDDDGDGTEDDQLKPNAAGAKKSPAQSPMTAKVEAAPPAESQEVVLVGGENKFEPSAEREISTEANTAGPTATDAMNPFEISTEANAEANTAGPTATDAMNPFASFAFGNGITTPLVQSKKRPLPTSAASRVVSQNTHESKKANPQQKDAKKRRRCATKNKCDNDDYVPVRQLPVEQQEEIRTKWQSLGDPNEPLEVRRFQVLVAARLHAQSREPVVRAAMDNLRKYFIEQEGGTEGGTLNAKNLSKADPKEIAKQIPSILFANVKAEHVVKAAKEVCSRFGGNVPQTQHGLKELTGIGPKLADILAFANSHRAYETKT